jgi:transcriptional regulator with XRE-family HTH domain
MEASAQRFGDNLRRERARRRLTQAALGQLAGISKSEGYRLEAGTRDPRMTTVISLARALKLKAADLMRGVE